MILKWKIFQICLNVQILQIEKLFKNQRICEYIYELWHYLEIKTFGLVLEFDMSFQEQEHSVAFMLLYSDLTRCLDLSFLTEIIADWTRQGFFEVVEQLWLKTFFNKLTPSCHFCPLRGVFYLSQPPWGPRSKKYAHVKL